MHAASNIEALLHRRLHRLKSFIYDFDALKDYTSDNISAMPAINFLPELKNPCFLSNDPIVYEEGAMAHKGSVAAVLFHVLQL